MAMIIHLHIVYGGFYSTTAEWVIVTKRPHGLQNFKYFLSGSLQNKFAAPCLEGGRAIRCKEPGSPDEPLE